MMAPEDRKFKPSYYGGVSDRGGLFGSTAFAEEVLGDFKVITCFKFLCLA
jgi:hypothetical protein